jgi:hypothetical protein
MVPVKIEIEGAPANGFWHGRDPNATVSRELSE